MDNNIEEKFVKKFIKKEKQDRTLFELRSLHKRNQAILKLTNLVSDKYIILCTAKVTDDEILQIIKREDISKKCYFIADRFEFDGEYMESMTALKLAFEEAFACVLIFNENLIFLKDEVGIGSPIKMILKYKN